MLGLVAALVATALILATNPTVPAVTRNADGWLPEVTLAEAAPGARPEKIELDTYTPLGLGIGTQAAPDGAALLVMHGPEGTRQLRRLPKQRAAEFAGMVADGPRLVWLELTIGDRATTEGRLWTMDSRSAEPRMITDDLGDVAVFDKRDDLVVHDGEVSWVAAGQGDRPQTEIRTVPLTGGRVRVEKRDGAWSLAGWPWLTTVNLGGNEPIELRNLVTGEVVTVPVRAGELKSCSPAWCRSIIIAEPASTVIELQKPDGSKQLRAAAGKVAASLADVALLDRFEVYSHAGGRLVMLDIERKRLIVLAEAGVKQVTSRGTTLSWSTGAAWHVLDLKTIP